MPIAVKCSECGKQYRLKDAFAGKLIACKKCNTKIRVPAPGQQKKKPPVKKKQADADPWDDEEELDSGQSSLGDSNPWDDDDDDELDGIPQRKPRKSAQDASAKKSKKGDDKKKKKGEGKGKSEEKSKLPLLLGIGGGVLFLLIGGGVLTWFLLSDSTPVYNIGSLPEWKRVSIEGESVSILMPGVPQVNKAFNEENGGKSHQFYLPLREDSDQGYFWELSFIPSPEGLKVDSTEFFNSQTVHLIKSLKASKNIQLQKQSMLEPGGIFRYTQDNEAATVLAIPTKTGVVLASYIAPDSDTNDEIRKKFLSSLEIDGKKVVLK